MNVGASFFLLLLLIFAQGVGAQTPSPPPGGSEATAKTAPPKQTVSSGGRPKESGEDDVVRVNTTLVTVPVSVMDRNGKYILDLCREDFRLYEDGAEQEIAYFDPTEKPFTIALLLDISDSMRFRIGDIQDAATAFVNQLRQDDRVMVIAFDSQVRILAEPTTNHDLARDAIRRTRMGAGTRLYDAIDFVLNHRFKHIRGRKAMILFTDGIDTGSFQASFKDDERDAEESDVLIYPVQYSTSKDLNEQLRAGLSSPSGASVMMPRGNGASTVDTARADSYLRAMSQRTGARLYRVDDAQDLTRSFIRIAGELRQQYSLGYYPKAPAQPGQRREIKIRVNRPGLSVRARGSYIFGPSDGTRGARSAAGSHP